MPALTGRRASWVAGAAVVIVGAFVGHGSEAVSLAAPHRAAVVVSSHAKLVSQAPSMAVEQVAVKRVAADAIGDAAVVADRMTGAESPAPDAAAGPVALLPAGGSTLATLSASSKPAAGRTDQGAQVYLSTGAAPGCQRLEGSNPPTMACSLAAGREFMLSLVAKATFEGNVVPVSIDVTPYLPGAVLALVDGGGNELAQPCTGEGSVSCRYRVVPPPPVNPSDPVQLDFFASTPDGSTASLRVLLHSLSVQQPSIVGYVYIDANGNGQQDQGEAPLPGAAVYITGPSNYNANQQCDGSGRFQFQVPGSGGYEVSCQTPAGYIPTTPTQVPVNIYQPGSSPAPIQLYFGYRSGNGYGVMQPTVTTTKGCLQSGEGAQYHIGDRMNVSLAVAGVPSADVRLLNLRPDGQTQILIERKTLPGGQYYSFQGQIGEPTGDKTLRLEAYPVGRYDNPIVAECTYHVVPVAPPDIYVTPGTVDFGSCGVGATNKRQITVANDGSTPLYLSSVSMQGGGASPYTIVTPGCNGMVVQPGKYQTIELGFQPSSGGTYQDFLAIRSNDPDEALVTVPLTGVTDGFQQGDLRATIRTDRGCIERFENPIYFVGDSIDLYFRVDGSVNQALARIDDVTSDGQTRTLMNQGMATGQNFRLTGLRTAPPIGNEVVRLTASTNTNTAVGECTFMVAASATRITGYKFHDLNGNGIWEGNPQTPTIGGNEPAIPGWRVTLSGPQSQTAQTDGSGRFQFAVTAPGSYTISEESRDSWRATTPAAYQVTLQMFPGETVSTILFGNQYAAGGSNVPTPVPTNPPLPTVGPGPTSAFPTEGPSPTPRPSPTLAPPTPSVTCRAQISPRPTSLINVGEYARFTVSSSGAGSARSWQWTVDGEVLRDYTEGTRSWWTTSAMAPADFQRSTLAFYWKPQPEQRYPNNVGPMPRRVGVTVTTSQGGQCRDEVVVNVERNNNNVGRQAEDFYLRNHSTYIVNEHNNWHATYQFMSGNYDGTLFFDFHRQFLNRFNSWRGEFGYPPIIMWDPGTSLPRGAEIDHSNRNWSYSPQPKPTWFTEYGSWPRPWSRMPCDYTRGGQRSLREFPADRRLLGCAVTEPWHNGVHFSVGGDMLSVPVSPRDPIFWRWHNFLDTVSQQRLNLGVAVNALATLQLDQLVVPGRVAQQAKPPSPQVVYQIPFRMFKFVDAFDTFTVEFHEPVIGLTAGDLVVNGIAATSVTGDGPGPYVFSGFAIPGPGDLVVKLKAGKIKNLADVDYVGDTWRYVVVDPEPDADIDGLPNGQEVNETLTNPFDRDTDDDGLTDGDEVNVFLTSPHLKDTDSDSAGDKCELDKGTDPLDPSSTAPGCAGYYVFLCRVQNGPTIDGLAATTNTVK